MLREDIERLLSPKDGEGLLTWFAEGMEKTFERNNVGQSPLVTLLTADVYREAVRAGALGPDASGEKMRKAILDLMRACEEAGTGIGRGIAGDYQESARIMAGILERATEYRKERPVKAQKDGGAPVEARTDVQAAGPDLALEEKESTDGE